MNVFTLKNRQMSRQIDAGYITAVVLLDMSSAVYTVDHPVLIQRLISSGVAGLALQWFKSYLTGRSQYVKVNDTTVYYI